MKVTHKRRIKNLPCRQHGLKQQQQTKQSKKESKNI
jgi:hypothetical protein